MDHASVIELAEHVAKAIVEKADGVWDDTPEDERSDARSLAYASIEAHDAWLTGAGWRIAPPDTIARPRSAEEATAMIAVAKGYLDAQKRKPRLIASAGMLIPGWQ